MAGVSSDDGGGGSTDAVDGIKFAMSTGNITSGTIELYKQVTE
jgi:hypothetical protein